MDKAYVAVVGSGDGDAYDALAEEVGRLVALRGAVLLCGGLGGVMAAACRGAQSEGGTTVGILPTDDRSPANPHVDIAIATGMGEMRNALIVRSADVVIGVGGGTGTLSEIALALRTGTPVVLLESWDLDESRLPDSKPVTAGSPAEAVDAAFSLIER